MINQGLIKSTSMIFRKPLPQVVHSFGPIAEKALFAKAMWGEVVGWVSLGADSKYHQKNILNYPYDMNGPDFPTFFLGKNVLFFDQPRCPGLPEQRGRLSHAAVLQRGEGVNPRFAGAGGCCRDEY
jgi:hypothetical protein